MLLPSLSQEVVLLLPGILQEVLPDILREVFPDILREVLPDILREVLPDLLQQTVAADVLRQVMPTILEEAPVVQRIQHVTRQYVDGNKLRLKMCLLLQRPVPRTENHVNENMHRRIRWLDGQGHTLLCPVRVSCTECTKHVLVSTYFLLYFLSFRFVLIIGMAAQAALGF